MDLLNSTFYHIGVAVCLIGGIGIGALLTTWAIDKLLVATGNINIVSQWWLAKKFPTRFKG